VGFILQVNPALYIAEEIKIHDKQEYYGFKIYTELKKDKLRLIKNR